MSSIVENPFVFGTKTTRLSQVAKKVESPKTTPFTNKTPINIFINASFIANKGHGHVLARSEWREHKQLHASAAYSTFHNMNVHLWIQQAPQGKFNIYYSPL